MFGILRAARLLSGRGRPSRRSRRNPRGCANRPNSLMQACGTTAEMSRMQFASLQLLTLNVRVLQDPICSSRISQHAYCATGAPHSSSRRADASERSMKNLSASQIRSGSSGRDSFGGGARLWIVAMGAASGASASSCRANLRKSH
eukprot:2194647-Pyramimonas_sp.AAC.1